MERRLILVIQLTRTGNAWVARSFGPSVDPDRRFGAWLGKKELGDGPGQLCTSCSKAATIDHDTLEHR
jgi:hypothetical protein